MSFQIIQCGDYYIELPESFPCKHSDELRNKERESYDRIECIHKFRPYLLRDEMGEQQLLYHGFNKDRIQEKIEKDQNRDHINKLKRGNYHTNKKPPI